MLLPTLAPPRAPGTYPGYGKRTDRCSLPPFHHEVVMFQGNKSAYAPFVLGSGLSIVISQGSFLASAGPMVIPTLVPATVVALPANSTCYLYLNFAGQLQLSTSGF